MRCHFVPQSYLRRFRNSQNLLDCFDLHRERQPTRPKAVKQTAQIEDWYVLKGLESIPGWDVDDRSLEETFQKLFENDLTPSLDRLERGCATAEDKLTLSYFVAFQLHRVPISRDYYRRMQRAPDNQLTQDARRLRSAQIVYGFIGTAVSAMELGPFLAKSRWFLVRNEGDEPFITSDNSIYVSQHPKRQSRVTTLATLGLSGPELLARRSAYSFSISPSHVLYVNTSEPTSSEDVALITGRWDRQAVRRYNEKYSGLP